MTAPSSLPGHGRKPLTEEQIQRVTAYLFERSRQQQKAVLDLLGGPEVLSPLFNDDRASNPHKVSQTAIRGLTTAGEHLHALEALIVGAGVLHPSAPFTLIRAAIETAAAAVWVLAPDDRNERVLRALQLAVRDAIDGDTVARETGTTIRRPLEQRRLRIDALAQAGAGHSGRVKPPSSTDIVSAAEAAASSPIGVRAAWRVCSGFAHGRLWATISVLDREQFASATPGDVNLRITSSMDRVMWAAWAAADVIDDALALYRRRAVSLYPRPS